MKKYLLNICLLLLSLPYNAYSQVYLPNSNTWNKYVNNALQNASKYINNNEDKIFDIIKKSFKASKTNSELVSVNNVSLLIMSLQKLNKSFQYFYDNEIYGFTYHTNQLPVIIQNNQPYFKLKDDKNINEWNEIVDYVTDMIMNNASHAGYTTWQTPQSMIDKRNKEKQKAEKEKEEAEIQAKIETQKKEASIIKPDNPQYIKIMNKVNNKENFINKGLLSDNYLNEIFFSINDIVHINTDAVAEQLFNYYNNFIVNKNPDKNIYYEIYLEYIFYSIFLLEQIDTAYKNEFKQQINTFKSFIDTVPIHPEFNGDYVFMFDNKSYDKLIQIYKSLLKNVCKYISDSFISGECEEL